MIYIWANRKITDCHIHHNFHIFKFYDLHLNAVEHRFVAASCQFHLHVYIVITFSNLNDSPSESKIITLTKCQKGNEFTEKIYELEPHIKTKLVKSYNVLAPMKFQFARGVDLGPLACNNPAVGEEFSIKGTKNRTL